MNMAKIDINTLEEIFKQYLSEEIMYGFDSITIEPHLEVLLHRIKKEIKESK